MLTLIRRSFVVETSLTQAWNHLAAIERWPTWAMHIKRIELKPAGQLTTESEGVIVLKNGIRSTFRMTEFHAPHRWKWAGPFLWLTVHYDHIFEAEGDSRTRLTWIVEAEGRGSSVVGRLLAMIYARNLKKAIPRLVAEMNALAPPPGG